MGSICNQTCQLKATGVQSAQFLQALSVMEEWHKHWVPMPIPSLSQYAEDVDLLQVVQLDSSHPLKQAVEMAKSQSHHFPNDLELGVFVRDDQGLVVFVPSKAYIACLKEHQVLTWVSESCDYDEAERSWMVTFTTDWVPVYDYFRFLGLIGIVVIVEYAAEFLEYVGDYTYIDHKSTDTRYDGEEAKLHMLKRWGCGVEEAWFIGAGDYDTFEDYCQGRTLTNPEIVALIKAYFDKKEI